MSSLVAQLMEETISLVNSQIAPSRKGVQGHGGVGLLFKVIKKIRETKNQTNKQINILRVGVKRMGPDSFQWCPATGQGATGTN